MFETLEDKFEESKKPLDPGLPILMYSASAIGSCIAITLGMRRHGFSHLFSLVVWATMFLLSLAWLVTSLRSSVPNPPRLQGSPHNSAFAPVCRRCR
jgi:hypothetical protein